IVHANIAWSKMTGYEMQEVQGRTCRFLQGSLTDKRETQRVRRTLGRSNLPPCFPPASACTLMVVNYRKDGSAFMCRTTIVPIR
ncbi:hypothetical protein B484DRAFT_310851, partial [Ochromonadaceae sp. CCMP2298]